jgi:hypothetical protein
MVNVLLVVLTRIILLVKPNVKQIAKISLPKVNTDEMHSIEQCIKQIAFCHLTHFVSITISIVNIETDVSCPLTPWTEWSECSVTCGPNGIRHRSRKLLNQRTSIDQYRCRSLPLEETQACQFVRCRMYFDNCLLYVAMTIRTVLVVDNL